MSQFLFIFHCATSTLMYAIIRYLKLNIFTELSTLQIAGYFNIISLFILLPYGIVRYRKLIPGFKKNLPLGTSVIATAFKMYAIGHVSPRNTTVIAFTQPIFVIILSFVFLGEYERKDRNNYWYIVLSFLGALVFVGGAELQMHSFIYSLVFIHVILKAMTNLFIKKTSDDKHLALFYITSFYAFFGFAMNVKTFDYHYLIDPRLIALAIVATFSQLALIRSYSLASKISLLQNLDYSRIFFGVIWTALIFSEPVLIRQIIGMFIIFGSIFFSNLRRYKGFEKK